MCPACVPLCVCVDVLMYVQAQAVVHDFNPQEISNLMWAYAKLGVRPPQLLLVALWESVGIFSANGSIGGGSVSSSSSAGASSMDGSSSISISGAVAGAGGAGGSVGARLSAFKPQELAMLVWALAVLKLWPGGFGVCC